MATTSIRYVDAVRREGFIKRLHHWWNHLKTVLINDYDAKGKIKQLFVAIIDILFTGTALWYIVNRRDIVSYGLLAWLAVFYFDYVVDRLKGKGPSSGSTIIRVAE